MKRNRNRRTATTLLTVTIAALVLTFLVPLFFRNPGWTPPPVAVAFMGFTNSGAGDEALFALTNPPPVAVSLLSVRASSPTDPLSAVKERGQFAWGKRESWGLAYAIGVDTTNEPLRVVLHFRERSTGPTRLIERVREFFGEITHREREFFTGQSFYVTNETRVLSARL